MKVYEGGYYIKELQIASDICSSKLLCWRYGQTVFLSIKAPLWIYHPLDRMSHMGQYLRFTKRKRTRQRWSF